MLDGGVRPLEVKALAHFALGLVDGVTELLAVNIGNNVKRWHGVEGYPPDNLGNSNRGRCPSGQREQTVNLPALPT